MREVDLSELLALKKEHKDLIVLDCRGPDYWYWEHIPGTVNLRWKYVAERAGKMLPDLTTPIVTSCDGFTCPASAMAYEELNKIGYQNLYEYSGGISDWKARGMPTECDARYKIAENVYVFPNQSFYGSSVNCYLIEQDEVVVLIDGPQQLTEENEDFILNFGKPIEVVLTHAPTSASSEELENRLSANIWLHSGDKGDQWLKFKPKRWLKDGQIFGTDLTVVYTPGHTPGSISIFDSKNKLFFTGDHLSGNKDGKLIDVRTDSHARNHDSGRLTSITKLLKFDFKAILPFHYEQIRSDAKEKVNEFLGVVKYGKD